MAKNIENYINQCLIYARYKNKNIKELDSLLNHAIPDNHL